ncbi:MAG TPA: hypothetical protein VN578_22510 [Candidatus Binatia bacterium]|nr:hypothetical protein [Candidatus Binatia bacterium]
MGKRLVHELGCDPRGDTLSLWMAHYVAEQIVVAENAKGRAKAAAQKQCFKTVLSLWEHRASLPDRHRPLEEFEPVLRVLAGIDPEGKPPFYYRLPSTREDQTKIKPGSVEFWVDFVSKIDAAARVLIQTALDEACELAADEQTRALLKDAIRTHRNGDIQSVRILLDRADESLDPATGLILERVQKLSAFNAVCRAASEALKRRLKDKHPRVRGVTH